MSKLTDHQVLSFDVYGTLIDWETGVLEALRPSLPEDSHHDRQTLLDRFHHWEASYQKSHPDMRYSELLASLLPDLLKDLGITSPPSKDVCHAFGASVGTWPAFPDTVDALRRLGNHFKLLVLSNVDRDSFAATNAGPLAGVRFDAVLTAQDIGSYKPDPANFRYMLDFVRDRWGFAGKDVLQTAQSQFHDHRPAKQVGVKSVWIVRPGAVMGNLQTTQEIWDWRFDTLGQMADEVEREKETGKG